MAESEWQQLHRTSPTNGGVDEWTTHIGDENDPAGDAIWTAPPPNDGEFSTTKQSLDASQPVQGCCGLENLGNTCYLNASLQCVSAVPSLCEYFLEGKYNQEEVKEQPAVDYNVPNLSEATKQHTKEALGEVTNTFSHLLHRLWCGRYHAVRPSAFHTALGRLHKQFDNFQQHDSQEFLTFFLDGLHESLGEVLAPPDAPCTLGESTSNVSTADSAAASHEVDFSTSCQAVRSLSASSVESLCKVPRLSDDAVLCATDDEKSRGGKGGGAVDCPTLSTQSTQSSDDSAVSEQAQKTEKHSVVVDTFRGQFKSEVICSSCQHVSMTYEPFMCLSVPLTRAMEKQLEVIWVPCSSLSPRVRYLLTLHKRSTIEDVKKALCRVLADGGVIVSTDMIVMAEVFRNYIARILENGAHIQYVNDTYRSVFAFEMLASPEAAPDGLPKAVLIPNSELTERKVTVSTLPASCNDDTDSGFTQSSGSSTTDTLDPPDSTVGHSPHILPSFSSESLAFFNSVPNTRSTSTTEVSSALSTEGGIGSDTSSMISELRCLDGVPAGDSAAPVSPSPTSVSSDLYDAADASAVGDGDTILASTKSPLSYGMSLASTSTDMPSPMSTVSSEGSADSAVTAAAKALHTTLKATASPHVSQTPTPGLPYTNLMDITSQTLTEFQQETANSVSDIVRSALQKQTLKSALERLNSSEGSSGEDDRPAGNVRAADQTMTSSEVVGDVDSWKRCTICFDDRSDNEMRVHVGCTDMMCQSCVETTAVYYNHSFPCPTCHADTDPLHDYVPILDNPLAPPPIRPVSLQFIVRHRLFPSLSPTSQFSLICSPNVLNLPSRCRTRDLYDSAARLIPHLPARLVSAPLSRDTLSGRISPIMDEEFTTELPFSLALVEHKGDRCARCPYSDHCAGCILDLDGYINLVPSDCLALSFNTKVPEEWIDVLERYEDDESMAELCEFNHLTLSECLEAFTKREVLGKDNPWHCPCCQTEREAAKTMTVCQLPPVLIVHLKRFVYEGQYGGEKLDDSVKFAQNDVDFGCLLDNGADSGEMLYDLASFICHSGGLNAGHYTAYVRHPTVKLWYYFNDRRVTQEEPMDIDFDRAYVLFYIRQGDECLFSPPACETLQNRIGPDEGLATLVEVRNRLQAEQGSNGGDTMDDFASGGSPPPLVSPLDSPKYNSSSEVQLWAMDAYADQCTTEEEMVRLATERSLEDTVAWQDRDEDGFPGDGVSISWGMSRPSDEWTTKGQDSHLKQASDSRLMTGSPHSSDDECRPRRRFISGGGSVDEEVTRLLQKDNSDLTLEERLAQQRKISYHLLSESDD